MATVMVCNKCSKVLAADPPKHLQLQWSGADRAITRTSFMRFCDGCWEIVEPRVTALLDGLNTTD